MTFRSLRRSQVVLRFLLVICLYRYWSTILYSLYVEVEKVSVELHSPSYSHSHPKIESNQTIERLHSYDRLPDGDASTTLRNSRQTIVMGKNHPANVELDLKTHGETSIPQVYSQNISSSVSTATDATIVHRNDKYMLFNSHDGLSNQYFCLKGAIALAARMGRTLVLPPILPHHTTEHVTDLKYPLRFRNFRHIKFETIKADIDMAVEGIELPEWSELFNITFDDDSWKYHGAALKNLSVIELVDFVRKNETLVGFDDIEMFCENFPCPILNLSKYEYESSSQVAYVGSTFQLGFSVEVPFWKPSRKMLNTLRQVYGGVYADVRGERRAGLLPPDYVGMHVRVTDLLMEQEEEFNCNSPQFTDNFDKSVQHRLWKCFSEGKIIFLGTSSTFIKECVVSLAMSYNEKHQTESGGNHTNNEFRTQVFMVDDILNHDSAIMNMIQTMRVESSTVVVALDQFLIGLAPNIILVNMMPFTSTFQHIVRLIHAKTYRNYILSALAESHD